MDEFRFVSRFITIKLAGINPSQIMQIQKRKTGPVLWSRLFGGGGTTVEAWMVHGSAIYRHLLIYWSEKRCTRNPTLYFIAVLVIYFDVSDTSTWSDEVGVNNETCH